MEHCPACATKVEADASTCPQCGAVLAPVAARRKGLAIASLVLGILSIPTLGLLTVGGIAAVVLGAMAWQRASRRPLEYGGKGLAVGGIVCGAVSLLLIPVIGIVAAVAVPGLLRARQSANEAATMGNLRTILSAELTYASFNGGAYDRLECLAAPASCVPGASDTSFLPPDLLKMERSGYRLRFVGGPPAVADGVTVLSPSSLTTFAVVAEPLDESAGGRSFCVDDRGDICATTGPVPEPSDGRCDSSCPIVQ